MACRRFQSLSHSRQLLGSQLAAIFPCPSHVTRLLLHINSIDMQGLRMITPSHQHFQSEECDILASNVQILKPQGSARQHPAGNRFRGQAAFISDTVHENRKHEHSSIWVASFTRKLWRKVKPIHNSLQAASMQSLRCQVKLGMFREAGTSIGISSSWIDTSSCSRLKGSGFSICSCVSLTISHAC